MVYINLCNAKQHIASVCGNISHLTSARQYNFTFLLSVAWWCYHGRGKEAEEAWHERKRRVGLGRCLEKLKCCHFMNIFVTIILALSFARL